MNRAILPGLKAFAAVALTALVLAACSVQTRHRVLTFLFDSVPPLKEKAAPEPPGVLKPPVSPAPVSLPPAPEGPVSSLTLFSEEGMARRRVLGDKSLQHHRMPRRDCLICHDETHGLKPVAVVKRDFCDQCHGEKRKAEGWNHGPVNLGECLPCHRAGHDAPYPKLLDKPVSELCAFCHHGDGQKQMPVHKIKALRVDLNDCTHCHDPHRVF